MLDLLLFSLCCSLACTAIHVAVTWEGMVLYWVKSLIEPPYYHVDKPDFAMRFKSFLLKPIYNCLICMSSFWTVFFWCCYIKPIGFELLFAVLITCGFNTIISCFLSLIKEHGW